MCGRFYKVASTDGEPWMQKLWGGGTVEECEVYPGSDVLAYVPIKGQKPLNWGFHPKWAGEKHKKVINARIETAPEKPYFRDAWQKNRCLIPASAYFEWDSDKNKTQIGLQDQKSFCIAGLFDYSLHYRSWNFALLTTQAHKSIGHIHDRMPVILTEENYSDWLYKKDFCVQDLLPNPAFTLRNRTEGLFGQ